MYYIKNLISYFWQKIMTIAQILLIPIGIIMCIGAPWTLVISIPLFFLFGLLRMASEKHMEKRIVKRINKIGYDAFMAELDGVDAWVRNYQMRCIQQNLQSIDNNLTNINMKMHF